MENSEKLKGWTGLFEEYGTWPPSLAEMTYFIHPINIYWAPAVCMSLPSWIRRYAKQISFLEESQPGGERDLPVSKARGQVGGRGRTKRGQNRLAKELGLNSGESQEGFKQGRDMSIEAL